MTLQPFHGAHPGLSIAVKIEFNISYSLGSKGFLSKEQRFPCT